MIFTGLELVCPRGRPGDAPLIINLAAILASEARQDEVATVTKFKAPELLAEFNRTWRELHKLSMQMVVERNTADRALRNRRAVLILEIIPAQLVALKLTNNDAHRASALDNDPEYRGLDDNHRQIEAIIELLKGKMKACENAYSSVKKIMGEDVYNMAMTHNPNLSGDAGHAQPATNSGWGKARY